MPNFFYFDQNGQKQGPVDGQQLRTLAAQGIITPESPLETESGRTGRAGKIKGLFPENPTASVPPPAPQTEHANTEVPVPPSTSGAAIIKRWLLTMLGTALVTWCVLKLIWMSWFLFLPAIVTTIVLVVVWYKKTRDKLIAIADSGDTRVQSALGRFSVSYFMLLMENVGIPKPFLIGGITAVCLFLFATPFGGVFKSIRNFSNDQIIASAETSIANLRGKSGSGTEFLIEKDILITNKHVIFGEYLKDVEIHFPSAKRGEHGPYKGELIFSDPKRDISFLRVSTPHSPLRCDNKSTFKRGQDIIVIGNPGFAEKTLQNAVSKGVVSTEIEIDGQSYWQMGISINPGNSGGPVFDNNGNVIGIVTAKATKQEGVAFCVPPNEISNSLKIAKEQTKIQVEENRSMHDAIVFFVDVSKATKLMLIFMREYDKAMREALSRRTPVQTGMNTAKKEFGDLANAFAADCKSKHQSTLKQIVQDSKISKDVRDNLSTSWTNFTEIDRDVNRTPDTDADRFRNKLHEFSDKYEEIKTRLCISLGVAEEDLE